jgi:hypothetical protein
MTAAPAATAAATEAAAAAAAAAAKEALHSLTDAPANSTDSSSQTPGDSSSSTVRVATASEDDQQLVAGLAAAASAGDMLYLLRALAAWPWEEPLHAVLLPAVVAALRGAVTDMQLQVRSCCLLPTDVADLSSQFGATLAANQL